MKRFAQKSIGLVVVAAALVAAWFFLAPPFLGGGTSYVVLKGTSMAPHYRGGDLVLVRRRPSYRVGQIVAYRSDLLDHHVVMHRIVAVHAAQYSFKGDNNDFVDGAHPTTADLIGREWVRIPRLGSLVAWLAAPRRAPLVGAVAALLLLGGGVAPSMRRRKHRAGELSIRHEPVLAAVPSVPRRPTTLDRAAPESQRLVWASHNWRTAAAVAAACAAVAAILGLVAVSAFGRASQTTASVARAYTLNGSFSYAATARSSAVYPTGRIATGDPIFMRLVPDVEIRFVARFTSRLPHSVHGRVAMRAVLQSPQGWTRTFSVEAPRGFRGSQAVVAGTLQLNRLQSLIRHFQVLTGVSQSTYTLTVVPTVSIAGTVAGADVQTQFAPTLALAVDPVEVRIAPPDLAGPGPAPNPLIAEQSGAIKRTVPAHFSVLGAAATVQEARRGASVAALVALMLGLLAGAVALVGRRLRAPDEAARIARRYGDMVVPVTVAGLVSHANVVDVSSIERLVQIAERYDALILHERSEGVDAYLLEQGETLYRYRPASRDTSEASVREDDISLARV